MRKRIAAIVKTYFKYFAFFYGYLRNRLLFIIGFSFLVGLLDALSLSLFIPLFEAAGKNASNADSFVARVFDFVGVPFSVNTILLIMVLFFVMKGVLRYTDLTIRYRAAEHFAKSIRLGLLDLMGNFRYSKFVTLDQGTIHNTLSVEVAGVMSAYALYMMVVQNVIFLAVYIGLSFLSNWKFTFAIMLGGYLSRVVMASLYARSRDYSNMITKNNNVFLSQVIQQITNFKYLKSTATMEGYVHRIKETVRESEKNQLGLAQISAVVMSFREPLIIVFIALAIFFQYNFVNPNLAPILLSLMLFYRGFNSLMNMQQSWTGFLKYTGAIAQINSFTAMLRKEGEPRSGEAFRGFRESIRFDDVRFSFDDSRPIIDGVSFTLPKNQTMALVGRSGSGKTTLANLISGILEPASGRIMADGRPLTDFSRVSFRNHIGLISQENVVFNDSFFNNVSFWAEKTPEHLRRFLDVVDKADLSEFLTHLPQAEDTPLGDGGIIMSGGQRQRLSIARELYRGTEILILDEATSALDSQTEKLIQNNIDAIRGETTLVIIAHRLSTIKNADVILLLEEGRIIGRGTFEELLADSPDFARMVALQEI